MALTKISRSLLNTGVSDSSDATAITIDSSEKVGIGAAPTLGALHVTSSLTDIVTFENTDAGTTGAQLLLYHNSSSPADGDRVGALNFQGQDDGGNHTTFSGIRGLASDVSNGSEDGILTFSCTRAGSFTEAMRIESSGTIGIGTTSPDSHVTIDGGSDVRAEINLRSQSLGTTYNGGTIRFKGYHANASDGSRTWFEIRGQKENTTGGDVKGRIEMYINPGTNTMTEVMKIESNGDLFTNDGTVSSLASDSRVKSDVADLTDGLTILNQLRPVTFKYNTKSEFYNPIDETTTRYGFIADEVKTVAPQYIKEGLGKIDGVEVDDFKTLSMTKMIPMLVKAIQELKAENDSLKSRIETLEG